MNIIFSLDLAAFLFLLGSLILLWRERNRFFSLRPLIPAIILIGIGRISDMLGEHPNIRLSHIAGLRPEQLDQIFTINGNLADAIGAAMLIFGFISIIRFQQKEMKRIVEMEGLLPLCSNCKRFRTTDNRWLPIERYLSEMGAPNMTHGICPDCMGKLYGKKISGNNGKVKPA